MKAKTIYLFFLFLAWSVVCYTQGINKGAAKVENSAQAKADGLIRMRFDQYTKQTEEQETRIKNLVTKYNENLKKLSLFCQAVLSNQTKAENERLLKSLPGPKSEP